MLTAPPAGSLTTGPVVVDRRFWGLVVALVALIPAVIVLAATVRYTNSDPHGALLVTEQLLTNGTISVDAYGPDVYATSWNFVELDGRHYYYFPLGSSIGALPVVAIALVAGIDLPEKEGFLQVVTAALIASTSVLLMYRLGRFFVGRRVSLALSLVFWLASPLASTGGTAMWSQSFAVVFGLMSLIAVAAATARPGRWTWVLLGSSLFLAVLSRPTMTLLAVGSMVYVLLVARSIGLRSLALLTVLSLAFVGFNWQTFGRLVPPYYEPQRLASLDPLVGILGNLVSPSRGLLVFMPMVALIPLLALVRPRPGRARLRLLILALGWPVVTVIAVGRFPDWYGGWSYGPRLLTEIVPGLFLATVLVWPTAFRTVAARVLLGAWIVLAGLGFYVHTVQGLFNPWTLEWNASPEVNSTPDTLWDWRYPQFLHNEQRHAQRLGDYGE
jgi:hypothetical protein